MTDGEAPGPEGQGSGFLSDRPQLVCLFRGHTKRWEPGFLGPTWQCTRCGKHGDLEAHSQLTLGQHLIHLAVTALIFALLWLLLKWLV